MTVRPRLHLAVCMYCGNEMYAKADEYGADEVKRVLRLLGWGYRHQRRACPTCMKRCVQAGIA